nr:HK97-gp10 family putative phage morphogenesis protein [Falsirhodobacter halotolerans]
MKLDGVKELQAAMEQIAVKSTRTAVMRRALTKAAEPMRAKAELFAPRRFGDLADAIQISARSVGEVGNAAYSAFMKDAAMDAKSLGTTFDAASAKAGALDAMISARREAKARGVNPAVAIYMGPVVSAGVFYAVFQEFGTKHHTPDPFMRPAFDAEAGPTIERVKPLLRQEIDKAVARIAKRAARGR